ncbi:MAG: amidohydrolase [Bacteroidetes bacterium]|jgi:amidohydrolase|nr:amidohydrolase [Bacteroidota bacterium]
MRPKSKNSDWLGYMVKHRRYFHQYPELSYQELETQKYISEELDRFSSISTKKIAKTGLIADYNLDKEGPLIAIRADMDALPIDEQTALPFKSVHSGKMHACGHDAHMAMLLGVIYYCEKYRPNLRLRFIFQPSEENNYADPQGWSGAERVVREGGLENVDIVLGVHQRPDLPSGLIGLHPGVVMASALMFELVVIGKSSHAGAAPEKGIDAILVASDWVQSIQSIISRRISPRSTGVISVGTIEGGEIANVLSDRVRMTGTIRTRDENTQQSILKEIEVLNSSFESRYGAKLKWKVVQDVPMTRNDASLHDKIKSSIQDRMPDTSISEDVDMMAAEDFSFYSREKPSYFAFIGTGLKDKPYGLHHPKMQLDESALLVGATYFIHAADCLAKN